MKTELYKYDMNGLDNVYLMNGYTWQDTPHGRAIKIDQWEQLDRAIAKALITNPSKITGKEIRFLRQLFLLSQADFATMIGKDVRTVARWEKSGKTAKTTEMLARLRFAGLLDGNQTINSMVQTLNAIDHAKSARIVIVVTEKRGAWTAKLETVT